MAYATGGQSLETVDAAVKGCWFGHLMFLIVDDPTYHEKKVEQSGRLASLRNQAVVWECQEIAGRLL